MVEHQPRLLGSRVRFPAGAFAIFFLFCQSFTSNFPFPLSLPLSFPSSSFPFLSLRPFVCAPCLYMHFEARALDRLRTRRRGSTRRRGNHMYDHSRFQRDINDVTGVSLSLSLYNSQKSLTHNMGSASAHPIIILALITNLKSKTAEQFQGLPTNLRTEQSNKKTNNFHFFAKNRMFLSTCTYEWTRGRESFLSKTGLELAGEFILTIQLLIQSLQFTSSSGEHFYLVVGDSFYTSLSDVLVFVLVLIVIKLFN